MIIHKHKLIYIHIPKTGGSSIERAFRFGRFGKPWPIDDPFSVGAVDYEGEVHLPAILLKSSFPGIFRQYYKFAIVRNTWDFMLSVYLWLNRTYGLETGFRDWIKRGFPGVPERESNLFLKPRQLDWITDKSGNVIIDYIGRFDRLLDEFKAVCSIIGIDKLELPCINRTEHGHYSEYYDDESRQLIAERYRSDIDYFGFVFNDE